jgi:hypothetical protein
VTTAQYFAIWRAIAELAPEPGVGLRLASEIDIAHLPPANLAAYYATDFRDGLGRLARYKQLGAPEEMRIIERGGECTIELRWAYATEAEPPSTDAAFVSVELGGGHRAHPASAWSSSATEGRTAHGVLRRAHAVRRRAQRAGVPFPRPRPAVSHAQR